MDARDDAAKDQNVEEMQHLDVSKEATPPSEETETKISRKREREVSLEPATPQATTSELDPGWAETKDRRQPTKKNRISAQLDSTAEEEENGENASGVDEGMSCSPPTESKIRQISQGVEDLTWKNMTKAATPDLEAAQTVEAEHAPMDTEHTSDHAEQVEVPPSMRGENPPVTDDQAGEDEHAGAADPAELPPDAQPKEASPAEEHEDVTPPPVVPASHRDSAALSRQASDENVDVEKGLKRKMGDRTVSERRVPEGIASSDGSSRPAVVSKRPRDDDSDANPRLTKRPTPPPDEETQAESDVSASTAPSQTQPIAAPVASASQSASSSGFMSYASTSSPFATVRGPSLFAQKSWSPYGSQASSSIASTSSSAVATPTPSLGSSSFSSNATSSTPAKENALKRTGFEAFASSSSPFATAAKRSKSPPPVFGHRPASPARHHSPARVSVNAFSAYTSTGAQAFSTTAHKRAGSGSPALGENEAEASTSAAAIQNGDEPSKEGSDSEKDKDVSFGERLRAQKDNEDSSDDEKKLNLTEQEVQTGEEDEETVYQVRGKLFALSPENQWKEKGTGQLKLNVRREDGAGARLLMRKEAVFTLLLNATLFKGMKCFLAQDPRYIRFSVFEDGAATHYNLRVSNAKIASELLEEINMHIP